MIGNTPDKPPNMLWIETLFNYCERGTDPGIMAEPVNVLSNAAFFVSAWLAYRHQRRQPSASRDIDCSIFIALVALMGTGSTLFHIFAQKWAFALDAAPIAIFILVYLNYALNKFLHLTPTISLLLTGAFLLTLPALGSLPGGITLLNGSILFVPAWAALLLVSIILLRREHPAARWLATAAVLLAASLTFRTIDKAVCVHTTIADHVTGTHSLWHILNAVLLYLVVRAAIDHGRHGEQTYEVLTPVGTRTND